MNALTLKRSRNSACCLLFLLLQACGNGYRTSPVSEDAIQNLNDSIAIAQENEANWAKSPVDIAGHFYPGHSREGSNASYHVSKEDLSPGKCIVKVQNEGVDDDEVFGERRTLRFKLIDGQWKITELKYEVKRRD